MPVRNDLLGINLDDVAEALAARAGSHGAVEREELRRRGRHSLAAPGAAEILVDGKSVGFAGELHPQVLGNFSLEQPVSAFEVRLG